MKRPRCFLPIFAIFQLLISSPLRAETPDKTYTPHFHIDPGNYLFIVDDQSVDHEETKPKSFPDVLSSYVITMELDVEASAEHKQVIHVRYRHFINRVGDSKTSFDFDSDHPSKTDSYQASLYLLNLPFDVVIDPDGEIKQVLGFDAIWKNMLQQKPAALANEDWLKQRYGESALIQYLTSINPLPARPMNLHEQVPYHFPFLFMNMAPIMVEDQLTLDSISNEGLQPTVLFKLAGEYSNPAMKVATNQEANPPANFSVHAINSAKFTCDLDSGLLHVAIFKSRIESTPLHKEFPNMPDFVSHDETLTYRLSPGPYVPATQPADK